MIIFQGCRAFHLRSAPPGDPDKTYRRRQNQMKTGCAAGGSHTTHKIGRAHQFDRRGGLGGSLARPIRESAVFWFD